MNIEEAHYMVSQRHAQDFCFRKDILNLPHLPYFLGYGNRLGNKRKLKKEEINKKTLKNMGERQRGICLGIN